MKTEILSLITRRFKHFSKSRLCFRACAGAFSIRATLACKNEARYGDARLVSGNYFDVLGLRPALGRLLTEDDDRAAGGRPVAVLGYAYWVAHFGSDVSILNQTLILNGSPLTVVGVAQRGFSGERVGRPADVYVPVSMKKSITPGWYGQNDREDYWITLIARLKPGVKREQAETAMNVLYRRQLEQDGQVVRHRDADFLKRFLAKKIVLEPGEHGRGGLRDRERQPLLLLTGMTVLVLLIACANVANLELARAARRTREMAVRLALGASRWQLIRSLLLESCALAVAGGLCGLVAAGWTLRAVMGFLPPSREMRRVLSSDVDWRVLLFCLAISLATGVLFGLFPALQASRVDLLSALKEQAGQFSATSSAHLFRKMLGTAQVGISLLLLISAGLFAKTLVKLRNIDPGIQVDHLISFSIVPKLNGYGDERIRELHKRLGAAGRDPRREVGILGGHTINYGLRSGTYIEVSGYQPQPGDEVDEKHVLSDTNRVGADYFRTMGIPLEAGREFTRADTASAPKVAVVNEAFVRHFFAGRNPVGRYIDDSGKMDIVVVGVVKDATYDKMRDAPTPVFFRPILQQRRLREMYFYLRTAVDPEHMASSIRREVRAVDPTLPIGEVATMQAQIDQNIFDERAASMLTGAFAGLATLLAAIGLYGVLAFNVARRTREIGIRMALGAEPGRVRGLVIRKVLGMLVIGSLAGVGAALAAGRLIESYLYQMKAWGFDGVWVCRSGFVGDRTGCGLCAGAAGDGRGSDGGAEGRMRNRELSILSPVFCVCALGATYSKDVAPILNRHCVECHRAGEVAPMVFTSYQAVRPWAKAIKEKVVTATMPPWLADPHVGQFKNDRRLAQGEIETIVAWVNAGAPEGDAKDLPAAPHFLDGWNIGKPDLIIDYGKDFDVPATGVVDYKYFAVPTNFTEDKWIEAAEIRPQHRAVTHHINVFVVLPGESITNGALLTGYAPGCPR